MRSKSKITTNDLKLLSSIGTQSEPKRNSRKKLSNKVSISSLFGKKSSKSKNEKLKKKIVNRKKSKTTIRSKSAKKSKSKPGLKIKSDKKIIRTKNGRFVTVPKNPKIAPKTKKYTKKKESKNELSDNELRSLSLFSAKINMSKIKSARSRSLTHAYKKIKGRPKNKGGKICLIIDRKFWTKLPRKISVFMVYKTISGKVIKNHNVLVLHYRYKKNKKIYFGVLLNGRFFELQSDRIIKISPYVKSLKKLNRESRLPRATSRKSKK